LYYISPPVVYFNSITAFNFDPKSTTNTIADLRSDELPFINAKIGNALIAFEFNVDYDVSIKHYYYNSLRGRVGDQPTSKHNAIQMLWETGHSKTLKEISTKCDYDNKNCYEAKTVPVINDISTNTGYTTGGQNFTVFGFGFNDKDIDAKMDGVPCVVTSRSDYAFSCVAGKKDKVSVIDVAQPGQHGLEG